MANDNQTNSFEIGKKTAEPINSTGLNVNPRSESSTLSETQLSSIPQSLDAWVDSIFAEDAQEESKRTGDKSQEDYRPTINLSRFGLKTPEDVKKFLHSPAGEAIIGEIGAELALEKAIEDERRLEQQEKRLLMSRLQAMLFLWYLEKKAHAKDKIKELVIQQNELAIERAKTPEPQTHSNAISESIKNVEMTLSSYASALKAIEAKEQALDKKMEQLKTEEAHIEVKYEIYETNILLFEQFLDDNPELTPEEIQERIDALAAQMDTHADEVNELLTIGKDDEARALLHVLTGLNAQAAGYLDMLAVHRNEKYFVNADGEPVSSIKDAELTLNASQKLIKDADGQMYLIKATDDWEQIKADPNAKAEALKGYQALKQDPQAMSVKKVIQHNKVLENDLHSKQVQEVSSLKEENQAQKTLINNEVSQLTALRGNLLNQAKQTNQSNVTLGQPTLSPMPTPTPAPKAGGTAATLKASQATPVDLYKNRLAELKEAKQLTRDDLFNLASQAPGNNKIAANAYLQMMFVNMPRTGNIPLQTMQSMLKNMERFGVDATKGPVTSIKSPLELKQQNIAKNDLSPSSAMDAKPEEPKPSTLTPFSTTPSPFK
ncbi:hypothetical protein ELY21_11740 [Legionella sp. km535]|uniref:hypothetical protein n=1 Tax=Legionella sp. km535 TaxID=2498107 RepID=UPI000F8D48BE|nr:hypothetical protein [Legionella sp. km535]RUR17228.1 hypothetical protein ELY21_11740 [Legionella sp. km535]